MIVVFILLQNRIAVAYLKLLHNIDIRSCKSKRITEGNYNTFTKTNWIYLGSLVSSWLELNLDSTSERRDLKLILGNMSCV